MGETGIDEETFNDYLEDLRVHYTADKVCHRSSITQLNSSRDLVPPLRLVMGPNPDFDHAHGHKPQTSIVILSPMTSLDSLRVAPYQSPSKV